MAGVVRYQQMVPLQALVIAFSAAVTLLLSTSGALCDSGKEDLRVTDNSGLGTFKLTLKLERPALFGVLLQATGHFDDHVGLHYRRTQRLGV